MAHKSAVALTAYPQYNPGITPRICRIACVAWRCAIETSRAVDFQQVSPIALLFTDLKDSVVFADDNFLNMSSHAERGSMLGTPVHVALGTDRESASQLMQDARETGYGYQRPLDLRATTGLTVPVFGTSVAALNAIGEFIGTDIALHYVRATPLLESQLRQHAGILSLHVQQAMSRTTSQKKKSFIQSYFTSKLDAIQILIARMAGSQAREVLERMLNTLARENDWNISMEAGHISVHPGRTLELRAYGTLMGTAVGYAVDVAGRRLLAQELQIVDSQMDDRTLAALSQLGLYRIFDDIL